MARTHIQICGRITIELDGERVENRLPGPQGQALFAFLVTRRGREAPRAELLAALWPQERRPAAADAALSALLSKLRAALGRETLPGRGVPVLRLPADATVDLELARQAIHAAESAVAREEWTAAWAPARAALHTADRGFLPNHDSEWSDSIRRELEGLRVRALECVAASGLALGGPELASAERSGRRLVELAPHRESGYLHLMRAMARRDGVPEALGVYEQLRGRLRDDLGIAPGAAAQELHAELLAARG